MKRSIISGFIILLVFSFALAAVAQEKSSKQESKEVVKEENKTAAAKEVKEGKAFNSICPVSTEEIEDPILVEYKGKTYGVCCKSCLKKFKKDPEKYISRLSEDGKKIVKKKDS